MQGSIEQSSDIVSLLTGEYLMSPPCGIEMEIGHTYCFAMVVQFVVQQMAVILL
jgi:hypothetical protein